MWALEAESAPIERALLEVEHAGRLAQAQEQRQTQRAARAEHEQHGQRGDEDEHDHNDRADHTEPVGERARAAGPGSGPPSTSQSQSGPSFEAAPGPYSASEAGSTSAPSSAASCVSGSGSGGPRTGYAEMVGRLNEEAVIADLGLGIAELAGIAPGLRLAAALDQVDLDGLSRAGLVEVMAEPVNPSV